MGLRRAHLARRLSAAAGSAPGRATSWRMRAFGVLLASTCAATPVCAAELLGEQAFTDRYVEALTRLHPEVEVQTPAPLEVVAKRDSKSYRLYLDNAYLRYQSAPESVDGVIEHHIDSLEAVVADRKAPPDAARIVPVVKGDAFVAGLTDQVRANGRGELADFYVFEPLAEGLHVFYVFDYTDSVQYVTASDLARLELSPGDLRAIAVGNLRALMTDVKREGSDRWSFMVADGTYEASLLLLDGLWDKRNFALAGELVVFVLARDSVLVVGSEDSEAIDAGRSLAEKAAREWPYFVSPHAYVHGAGGWTRYRP